MGKGSSNSSSSSVPVLQWLNQMVSEPHYLFHFLTFFSYFVIRSSATHVLAPNLAHHLLRREIQTLLVFAVLAFIKGVREETWEAFIADTFFLAKVIGNDAFVKLFTAFLKSRITPPSPFLYEVMNLNLSNYSVDQICLFAVTFTMDRRLAVWYVLTFLVIHVLTQQPPSEGLGTCSKLTPLLLESLLTEGNTTRFWLVEFCASYSSACIRSSQHFPELSITYSSKILSFGIVDLGLFPNAAEKFGISLSGSMGQLPTYILFDNATEVARFPELGFKTTFFHPTITKGLLSRHFELDRHLLEYVNGK